MVRIAPEEENVWKCYETDFGGGTKGGLEADPHLNHILGGRTILADGRKRMMTPADICELRRATGVSPEYPCADAERRLESGIPD